MVFQHVKIKIHSTIYTVKKVHFKPQIYDFKQYLLHDWQQMLCSEGHNPCLANAGQDDTASLQAVGKTSKEEHGWLIRFFSIMLFQRMRGFFKIIWSVVNNSYYMTGNRCFAVKDINLVWPTRGKTKPHPYKLLKKIKRRIRRLLELLFLVKVGKICIRADVANQACAYPGFCSMKRLPPVYPPA